MPLPLITVFADMPNPRMEETANKLHKLVDILVIARSSAGPTLDTGRAKEGLFRRFLELPKRRPATTPSSVFFIKLARLRGSVRAMMKAASESTGLVPGVACPKFAKDTFTGCLHVVSSERSSRPTAVLGARCVPEGGHEITTIPRGLRPWISPRGGDD